MAFTEIQRHGGGSHAGVSPRNDTEDHGKGDGVVLVLSKAVPVIVIDARDVGRWGWRTGVGPRKIRISRKEDLVVLVRSGTRFGSAAGWPRNDTDDHGKEGV